MTYGNTSSLAGHLGALTVMAVWGSTFVSSKMLLGTGLMPADIFFFRFLMAYVPMAMLCHKRLWASSLADELTLAGLGVMGGSLYFLLENMALVHSTASNVGILVSTTPLITAVILALSYRDERSSRQQIMGSVVAFAGAALVVLNGQLVLHLQPLGDALALGAAFTWALYSLLMKRVMGRYSAAFITRKVFAYGLLTILPYFALVHPLNLRLLAQADMLVWGNLVFLGWIASLGAYLLWNWVMARLGAVRSTNYIYGQPLVTMTVAALTLGERITPMAIAGVALLIGGLWMADKKK